MLFVDANPRRVSWSLGLALALDRNADQRPSSTSMALASGDDTGKPFSTQDG